MKRLACVLALCFTVAACSGSSSTSPSPSTTTTTAPPSAPMVTGLSVGGGPCANGGSCVLPGPFGLIATATLSNGATQTVTTSANWSSSNGAIATVNGSGVVSVHAQGSADITASYQGRSGGVTVLVPAPWTTSGAGDTTFPLPSYVSRVRIDANYAGRCQNFAVDVASRLIVNIIIGTCSVADTTSPFTGTYNVTPGGLVEITISTGVNWRFTEVRP